jgi:chloramphenicol-sensitive protein RarD
LNSSSSRGVGYAAAAYVIWGLFPLYWKLLQGIPALELIGHRVVWSCVMLAVIVLLSGRWREFLSAARDGRALGIYATAGVLIAVNWLVYIWGVTHGFIVETSLGYFINPLVSILLGVFVLHERLRVGQWISIALAAVGVLYLGFAYGSLPWLSLTLACTFGLYGLVKKKAPLGAVYGLALETILLFLPAAAYLAYVDRSSGGAFMQMGIGTDALLIGGGIVTTIPLLLFAAAAQKIRLSLMGLLQYVAPTLQFLVGVFVYKEPFSHKQLIGFTIVWVALAMSAIEGMTARRFSAD